MTCIILGYIFIPSLLHSLILLDRPDVGVCCVYLGCDAAFVLWRPDDAGAAFNSLCPEQMRVPSTPLTRPLRCWAPKENYHNDEGQTPVLEMTIKGESCFAVPTGKGVQERKFSIFQT